MRRTRPSPATVISLVALFVALGGTSYAVTALPRDSVGSRQIRARAVKEGELGNRSVITRKLANGAVTTAKLAPGAVTGDRVAADALSGTQVNESTLSTVPFAGDADRAKTAVRAALADHAETAGRADRAGVAEALSNVDLNSQPFEIPDGAQTADQDSVVVACDAGLAPLSGGFAVADDSADPLLRASAPVQGGWRLELLDLFGQDGFTVHGTAYAVCVETDGK